MSRLLNIFVKILTQLFHTNLIVMQKQIDSKPESHNYIVEKITTTVTLYQTDSDKFGLSYDSVYSGVQDGNYNGGPFPVTGNGTSQVHQDPDVTITISNYSDTGSYISMHVTIIVTATGLGTHTIYSQTLGGAYSPDFDPAGDFVKILKKVVNAHTALASTLAN